MSPENPNHEIYETNYSAKNLELNPTTSYDREIINQRASLIAQYGHGKDVLDLCCGSGVYLLPHLSHVKSAVGVDFSNKMLGSFKTAFAKDIPPNLTLVESDASALPLHDRSIDFVFSYTALYHVPNLRAVISEVARVLRTDGIAALEVGNLWSLNTIYSYVWHWTSGWGRPYHCSLSEIRKIIRDAGLVVLDWEAFQFIPLYTSPKPLLFLHPFFGGHWKRLLGLKYRGRMLDSWISNSPPLKPFSFRHLIILRKS